MKIVKQSLFLFCFSILFMSCEKSENLNEIDNFNRNNPPCLISKIQIASHCNDCDITYEEWYTYNEKNQIKSIEYINGNKNDTSANNLHYTYLKKFTYDSIGRPTSRIIDGNNGPMSNDTLYYEYNGDEIEAVQYIDGARSKWNTIILDNNLNPLFYYQPSKSGSVNSYSWLNGNIIHESFKSAYSGSLDRFELSQEFNNNINPLAYSSLHSIEPVSKNLITKYSKTTYYKDPVDTIDVVGQFLYTYNDNGFPIEILRIVTNGVTTDTTKYFYEYYKD